MKHSYKAHGKSKIPESTLTVYYSKFNETLIKLRKDPGNHNRLTKDYGHFHFLWNNFCSSCHTMGHREEHCYMPPPKPKEDTEEESSSDSHKAPTLKDKGKEDKNSQTFSSNGENRSKPKEKQTKSPQHKTNSNNPPAKNRKSKRKKKPNSRYNTDIYEVDDLLYLDDSSDCYY